MKRAVIYKITNDINGKSYIGVSIKPQQRILDHLRKRKGCSSLVAKAVDKYGVENFTFEILLVSTESYCYEMESKTIAAFDSQQPNGYNIAPGGERPPSLPIGSKRDPAVIEKMKSTIAKYGRPKCYGHILSDEAKARIGAANSLALTGRKQSQETIDKRKATIQAKRDAGWVKGDKGVPRPSMQGREFSDEHKAKLSAARKGKAPWNKGL